MRRISGFALGNIKPGTMSEGSGSHRSEPCFGSRASLMVAFSVSQDHVWGRGFDSGGRSVEIEDVVIELILIDYGFG